MRVLGLVLDTQPIVIDPAQPGPGNLLCGIVGLLDPLAILGSSTSSSRR